MKLYNVQTSQERPSRLRFLTANNPTGELIKVMGRYGKVIARKYCR